jgi:hypothetical protein
VWDSPVWNVLNKYYELKNKYQENLESLQQEMKEKKDTDFLTRLPACVNCKNYVGMTFSCKLHGVKGPFGQERLFSILCGADPPCMKIEFGIPVIDTLDTLLEGIAGEIVHLKENIITCKNDLIFDYKSEEDAVDYFTKEKKKLNETLDINEFVMFSYDTFLKEDERKQDLHKLENDRDDFVQEYIGLLNDPTKDKETRMQEAMHLYVHSIRPLDKEIRENKYRENVVERENDYDDEEIIKYKLLQKSIPLSYKEMIGYNALLTFTSGEWENALHKSGI